MSTKVGVFNLRGYFVHMPTLHRHNNINERMWCGVS